MSQRIAFLGLGVMGAPMAGHLRAAGYEVVAYNRTEAVARQWQAEHGGSVAATAADAAAGSAFVFSCLGDDPDLREVLLGSAGGSAGGPAGVVQAMEEGAVLIDHTTASARLARELAAVAAARGVGFLDAPVSGGQAGAESGQLTIMVGGAEDVFERALPLLDVYSRRVRRLGPAGSGQLTKMVNQICIAGLLEGLAEGLHFARMAGLDPEAVVDVISQGAAQSWQMDHRWRTMVDGEFDHGFAVQWMRKDLRIALEEGRARGAHLPVAALVDQLYAEVESMGGERWDTSSLIARLEGLVARRS